ncbi:ABC-2 type transport system ATP-binding protein [Lacibacter cauensis]|uniref:ABC-2 type transport system ATP-binding protein n=1 Tax=Lacibacter cauensis TaxID=510947 RepID=A0A562SRP4_9BACT|nr:gliding motility-associated ABC transporter ATP-binding subunit GldA [Lacibacter cauensis]TWI83460.1 ABC-2 type transport system ATP-binding protein [Lacibacter cauensis]
MSIEVNNLVKNYGEQKAVNGISFKVNKGEIVGFLGPNGAGKSTTMKMITGYLQPSGGEALVCNIKVNDQSTETKQKIGYLPESNALYYDMYVREYLAFIAEVHQIENQKSKIEHVIEQVGLTPEAHKKIAQLSKGYKQRVGLAAALIHDPEVLILDEPTSGLDPNQIVEIRNVIKELGKNKTVLFSSHIMQEVQALCERVIIINKGNIVADDQLSHLVKNIHSGSVTLEIKEEIDESLFNQIQNISRVNRTTWNFKTDNPEQLKKQLLQICVEKNLNILSLTSDTNNLEDVFRSLTA